MERFTAAAAAFFIGVAEGKTAFEFVLDIIHFGADQEHHGFRVNQHLHAVTLHHLVKFADLIGIFDGVGKTGAATRAYIHLDTRGGFATLID